MTPHNGVAFRISAAVLLLAAAHFAALSMFAQSTFGSFVGTVKDPSGAVVAGCGITVRNTATSTTRTALTDSSGNYTVVNLDPGQYDIVLDAKGFRKTTVPDLTLLARQTVRVDGTLSLESQTQVVEVNIAAEAPINTEVSNISESKLGRELIDLPVALGSRASGSTSAFSTLTTQPGVEIDNSGNMSVAGGNVDMLSMSIDGISTVSARNSAPMQELFPSFDGIAEIRVSEVNNTAEYGGISDVTTISKGGGNVFHGSLFENHQNSAFAARNTFSNSVPPLIMNNFGGSFGGPVMGPRYNGRDKTFFFVTYEGLRLPSSFVLLQSVPSVALRSGDLSVYPAAIKDPLGGTFSGNQIPVSRIADLSKGILQTLFPLPNTGPAGSIVNNYQQNVSTPITSNQGDIRLDRNISSKQSAFARFTYKRLSKTYPPCNCTTSSLNGSALAGAVLRPENDWSLAGAHNYVISPRLVNEFRGGWTGLHTASSFGINGAQIEAQLGLTPYIPQSKELLANVSTTPNIRIAGFQRTGGVGSNRQQTSTFQVLDNLTYTAGRHTLKFGGDFRYLTALYTSVFDTLWLGRYNFTNSAVTRNLIGNAYASFLLGVPDSDTIATVLSPDTQAYGRAMAFYAQDDWKVTSRLTLNYGLRWEYHPMFQDHLGNVAAFLADRYAVVNGVTVHGAVAVPNGSLKLVNPAFAQSIAPTPILTADQAGIPNSLRYSQKTDFAPRIGFAWRITGDGKTVLRGGYGRFIDAPLGFLILSSWAVEASDVATFSNSVVGGKPQLTFPYPFPSNLAQPGSQDFDLSYALHYKDPYVQQWNFTIERDLGFQTGLRVSYDGSHGSDLSLTTNPDQVPANTVGFDKASAAAPYPLWDSLVNVENGGRSNYQAITIAVNKRISKGLQFSASYNHSKNLSNAGGFNPTSFAGEGGGQTSDYFNPNLDYGRVPFTRNHRFLTTFLYETKFNTGRKALNFAVTGWEIAGVLTFQTGPYLSVTAPGTDPSGTNFDNSFNGGDPRADRVTGQALYPANQSIQQWVNPAAFALPPDNIGRYGTAGVGSVIGPGMQTVALSMYRIFTYKERYRLRIGASSTNLFNHPNYGVPILSVGTPTFGQISSLQSAEGSGPRAIQLGARIWF